MDTKMMSEEIIYCTSCGAANKKSAVTCTECEKKIEVRYRPFYDYLKSHVKAKVEDQVTETVYSLIKKYLLSHLYGVIFAVTVVATAVAVNASGGTMLSVDEPVPVAQNPAVTETPAEVPSMTAWDIDYLWHVVSNYDSNADDLRSYDRYWSELESVPNSELFAEEALDEYNYPAVHELVESPVEVGYIAESVDPSYVSVGRYMDENSIVSGENVTTALGKQLYNDGYFVAEANYILMAHNGEINIDNPPANPTEKYMYRMVFVKSGDKWYIAEDRRIA